MSQLLPPELVALDQELPDSRESAISVLASLIGSAGRGDEEGVRTAMLNREEQMPTGMPGGFAIPHCKSDAVTQPSLCFVRTTSPIDFGAADGPADIIIGICAPEGASDTHLQLLAKLARSLVTPGFLESLRSASSPDEVSRIITDVVADEDEADDDGAEASNAAEDQPTAAAVGAAAAPESEPAKLLAITSCPTGIAHTYMAAESLENAAHERGVELAVEPQGSGGYTAFTREQIDQADALIIAADVAISGRERFAGMPVVESGVKRAIASGPELIDEAIDAKNNPEAAKTVSASSDGEQGKAGDDAASQSWPRRIQAAVMTGVSYMIPFVAAGGLLIALGFLIGGYDVKFVAEGIVLDHSLWNLPGHVGYDANGVQTMTEKSGLLLYLGSVLTTLGEAGMGFLVAALSGYIAFGLAGRPGIAPGFIGGAISVLVGAGFLGGLVTGILGGLIAYALTKPTPPRWLAGLMPVAIIPLITTLIVGALMLMFLGRPLAALMTALQDGLQGMSGSSALVLGLVLGLMMCVDLGGPVNKAAYLFATAGLSQGTEASFQIMAAVMSAGMVPPLALALSTAVRKKLYTKVEQDNGKAAWLLGAAFISEGAIPFAAADPLRVIPSMMAGGAVTGALSMLFGVGSQAPHGGIFVIFAISPVIGYLVSVVAGVLVAALLVTALKEKSWRAAESSRRRQDNPVAAN